MKEVRDATARILDHTTLAALNAQVARTRRKRPSKKVVAI
jgi:DNA-binding IscR family transcriptional regulator